MFLLESVDAFFGGRGLLTKLHKTFHIRQGRSVGVCGVALLLKAHFVASPKLLWTEVVL